MRSARVWGAAGFLILAGCAGPKYQAGREVAKGVTPVFPPRPDSLRAELSLTGYREGKGTTVGAAFAAKPFLKYKLDLFGVLPGVVGASFLWADTGWTLVLFERDGYLHGRGERASMPGVFAGPASVHDLFAFLWGGFFPGLGDTAARAVFTRAEDGAVEYRAGEALWRARVDSKTGLVRAAWRVDSLLRFEYSDYATQAGRPLPKHVKVYAMGELALEIRVGKADDNPAWRRDPFFIKIPKGFQRLEAAP